MPNLAHYYHVGLNPFDALATVAKKGLDRVDKHIREQAAKGATEAVKPVARKEAADGARSAVTPMVVGVGAVSVLALLVALRK